MSIGRNELCPCGSGKKHKRCCLPKREAESARTADVARGLITAAGWLMKRHPEACHAALEDGFYGGLDEESRAMLEELPKRIRVTLGRHYLLKPKNARNLLKQA